MRDGRPLKVRVANFNLLNFHEAGVPFYQYKNGMSEEQVEAKIDWTAGQLKRLNAAIVGFQEVFSVAPLIEAAKRAGYDMAKTKIVAPCVDGKGPAVALLSTFPIVEHQSFSDFPPEAKLDLAAGSGGPPVFLPISKFNRPVLRVVIELDTGHRVAVYVCHLKSKRPVITDKSMQKDLKSNAIGSAISLTIRAAEAAALRCLLLDELAGDQEGLREVATSNDEKKPKVAYIAPGSKAESALENSLAGLKMSESSTDSEDHEQSARPEGPTGKQYPTIVMGDLNDVTHAVSTEILSGTQPFKRLPFWEKEILWSTLLHSAHDVQARTADKDVNYTYIHNGRYECLDNILVSNALVRANKNHIGYVQWLQCFNDHLIDNTLAEDDDDYDSPLTLPPAPHERVPSNRSQSRSPSRQGDVHAKSLSTSPPKVGDKLAPASPSPAHRAAKFKGRDVTKSDHGQVVALLKIFPPHLGPNSEYGNRAGEQANPSDYYSRRQQLQHDSTPKPTRWGEDGMADETDGEEENNDIPERLRKHKGHRRYETEEEETGDLDADEVANVYYAHTNDAGGRAIKSKKH
ncbi:hypothetical protein HDU99_006737 [Rhizoclosmatium hyalinum]|nr:hypothetical protein HDU99_006737 [Rhizoclosmatium hyalinum]